MRPVFVAVAEPESVNLGLVVGSERALLVDTGSSPAQGRAVRASVAAVTDRPLAAVVVTHWHYDHAFGLAAFADLLTIGHESVRPGGGRPRPRRKPPAGCRSRRPGAPAGKSPWRWRSISAAGGWRSPTSAGAYRRRPGGRGAGRGGGLRRRPDRVGRAAVVRRGCGTRCVGRHPRRGDRADDGDHGAVPGHGEPVDREFVFEQRGRIAAQAAGGLSAASRPAVAAGAADSP